MEQKRRTITTRSPRKKRENKKKFWTIAGVVLGLVIVFFVSYKIAFGLISAGNNPNLPEKVASSSTEEDIANMSREDLEESYTKLKKQLEDKEEEIEMLKERLDEYESSTSTPAPEETTSPTASPEEDDQPASTPKPTAPPAATAAPSGGLMSPEELQSMAGGSGE